MYSCSSSVKIKDFKKDYTQNLKGTIKSMNIKNYEYKFIKKDTVLLVKNTILNFDSNNNIMNENVITENGQEKYTYKYLTGLVVEKKSIEENNTSLTTYKYDEINNQIEENSFDEKRVFSLETRQFDKYHNLIEKKTSFFGKKNIETTIEYDYKNRILISKNAVDTFSNLFITTKKHFNKKGYITKIQPVSDFKKFNYFTFEIDRKGNLTKKTYFKSDDSIIETVTYKNTYDKMGNIIIRERFLNGKIIEKFTFEITYY